MDFLGDSGIGRRRINLGGSSRSGGEAASRQALLDAARREREARHKEKERNQAASKIQVSAHTSAVCELSVPNPVPPLTHTSLPSLCFSSPSGAVAMPTRASASDNGASGMRNWRVWVPALRLRPCAR